LILLGSTDDNDDDDEYDFAASVGFGSANLMTFLHGHDYTAHLFRVIEALN